MIAELLFVFVVWPFMAQVQTTQQMILTRGEPTWCTDWRETALYAPERVDYNVHFQWLRACAGTNSTVKALFIETCCAKQLFVIRNKKVTCDTFFQETGDVCPPPPPPRDAYKECGTNDVCKVRVVSREIYLAIWFIVFPVYAVVSLLKMFCEWLYSVFVRIRRTVKPHTD